MTTATFVLLCVLLVVLIINGEYCRRNFKYNRQEFDALHKRLGRLDARLSALEGNVTKPRARP